MAFTGTVVTLKNTLQEAVVKLVGSGDYTITLGSLIHNIPMQVTSARCDGTKAIVNFNVPYQFTTGSKVTIAGMTSTDYNGTFEVTAGFPGTVHFTVPSTIAPATVLGTICSALGDTQTVHIQGYQHSTDFTTGILVTRASTDILQLYGSDALKIKGFTLNEEETSDIVVTMPTISTLILDLKKLGGYGT